MLSVVSMIVDVPPAMPTLISGLPESTPWYNVWPSTGSPDQVKRVGTRRRERYALQVQQRRGRSGEGEVDRVGVFGEFDVRGCAIRRQRCDLGREIDEHVDGPEVRRRIDEAYSRRAD